MTIQSLVDHLLKLAPHTVVVHHVPGRIRIRLLPGGLRLAREVDLEEAINRVPGIRKVRVNPFAASVIVEYDRGRLSTGLWDTLDEVRKRPESAPEAGARLVAMLGE